MAKKQKKSEQNDRSVAELKEAALTLDRELFALRSELSLNRKLEKPHLLKAKKRERAQVLTLMTQKQRSDAAKGA